MPQGFAGLQKAAEEIEARKAAGGGGGFFFKLPNSGDVGHVRFVDSSDEVVWAWVHEVPVEGRQWGDDVPCLDQEKEDKPCPGCERNLKRKVKVWVNVIWRDAPVYKRDENKKIVKEGGNPVVVDRKDQIALWSSGITLYNNLEEVEENWGLSTRDFKVKRKGSGLDTKYVIVPSDPDGGKKELSANDKTLLEKDGEGKGGKFDTQQYAKAPSYEDFEKRLGGGGGSSSDSGSGETTSAAPANPFLTRRS